MAAAREGVEQWRRGREKLGPMPEELWVEAVRLARTHGAYRVARKLGIDFGALKRRMGECVGTGGSELLDGFVELPAMEVSAGGGSATVEMVGRDGSRVLVCLPAGHHLDVAGLMTAFLEGTA